MDKAPYRGALFVDFPQSRFAAVQSATHPRDIASTGCCVGITLLTHRCATASRSTEKTTRLDSAARSTLALAVLGHFFTKNILYLHFWHENFLSSSKDIIKLNPGKEVPMVGVILIFAFAMSLLIEYVESRVNKTTDEPGTKTNEIADKNIIREPE